jgi:hypothetical protein
MVKSGVPLGRGKSIAITTGRERPAYRQPSVPDEESGIILFFIPSGMVDGRQVVHGLQQGIKYPASRSDG